MKPLSALALLLALIAAPAAAQPFRFVAFGDMPYCDPDRATECPLELERVQYLIRAINRAQPAFSIFLGDTQGGLERCDAALVDRTAEWFGLVAGPLVYTPGDNEWVDCWRDRAGRQDPLRFLQMIRDRFFAQPRSLGRVPIPLVRQADEQPAHARYVENALWLQGGMVFATLHVPGSNNNAPMQGVPPGTEAEYGPRNAANLAWIESVFARAQETQAKAVVIGLQADMYYVERCGRGYVSGYVDTRNALEAAVRRFGRPVLMIHGDSHFFLDDRPVPAVPNLRRLMVPGAQDLRAVLVEVTPDAADPFRFSLIGPGDRPARTGC